MHELLPSLLASNLFIRDGHCYFWKPGLLWLHIISNSLIAVAYYSISIAIARFVQKQQDLPYLKVLLLFSAFIIASGTIHIMDVWTLWHPTYWLSGFLEALTALISVYTAIVLIPIFSQTLALPSAEQLEATNYQLLTEVVERRRIKKELRSSQKMFQLVMDNIPQFIFWKDKNSVYLGCNRSFARAASLDNPQEIVGKTDYDLPWKAEKSDYLRIGDARVMATDTPYHIIEPSREPDGKQRWKDTNKIPLHDVKGNVVGILGMVEDITERKEAEAILQRVNEELEIRVCERTAALSQLNQQLATEIAERQRAEIALRKSEKRYRLLIEATSQIIWDTSVDGEFVSEQLSWSAFTGQTTSELKGWGWLNAIHPEDQLHTVQTWSQAIANGTFYQAEHRLRRYDGEYRDMSVRAIPVLENDNSIREWLGVHTDITENKRAEKALLSSFATNRALLNAMPDLMFRLSQDGILVNYKAPKDTQMLFSEREIIGKNIAEILPKDVAEGLFECVEQALQTGEVQVYEFQLPKLSDTIYWEARLVVSELNEVIAIIRNITERQRILKALEEREAQYRLIVETTAEGVLVLDSEGKTTFANNQMAKMLGYTLNNMFGLSLFTFIHEENQAQAAANIELCRQGLQKQHDFKFRRQDGTDLWAIVSTSSMFDSANQYVGALAMLTDITQRKLAEEALQQSEEKFRTIVENANDIIYLLKPNGIFYYVSPNWTEILGHNVEEVQGKSFESFLHPDDLLACVNFLEIVLTTGHKQAGVEYQIKHKDGSWKWHTSNVSVLKDSKNELLYFVGICRDITDRKRQEEELRFWQSMTQEIFASEDFISALKVALEKVCEATGWNFGEAWIPRRDSTALECSPAWYSNSDRLEPFRRFSEKFVFEPGIGLPGRVWLSKQPEWQRDVSVMSDKTYLRAHIALESGLKAALGIPIIADNNVLAVLVFYMFEAKEQDQRLIELISASTELGLILRRKQAEEEVSKALEQERELSELKSRFISMTSHEFRTPLTTILSSAELLEDYGDDWSKNKKVEHLQRIQNSVDRMTQLLNDVLLLGKVEAGKLECQPSPMNLNKFCSDLIEELQLGDGKNHTITFVKKGEWSTAYMDEKLLRQILSNLLSNAIKYSPVGSTVQMTASCKKGEVIFKIKDSGIGIPSEDLQRLFDTFHRAKNVGTIPGTGLGMAIVKKSVDLHGGQITVNTEVGVGTVFTVTLPLNQ